MNEPMCSIEGCDRPRGKRRGWCDLHYYRWLRSGSHEAPPCSNLQTTEERFWTQRDGTVLRSEHYGPWTPVEPAFPRQTCAGCGAEHPGEPCDRQPDLFGGAS